MNLTLSPPFAEQGQIVSSIGAAGTGARFPGDNPRVSVLMPVYNGQRYLSSAIESILNQTFTDFEYIIIDDGSTDNTWDILNRYATQDQRIRLARNEQNMGITATLNRGLRLARGAYIARQDADDLSLPARLAQQVRFMDGHPEVVLLSCDFAVIDAEDRQLAQTQRAGGSGVTAWYLLFYNRLGGHSQVLFRREAALHVHGYSATFRHNEDYDLWLRLAQVGQVVILPEVLLQWRRHSESISQRSRAEQHWQSLAVSRQAMAAYSGDQLSLEQVEALRCFWLNSFPDARQAGALDSRLRHMYQAFLRQHVDQNGSASNLARELALRTGNQFSRWALYLAVQRDLRAAFKVACYACAWHPASVTTMLLQALGQKLVSAKKSWGTSGFQPSGW